VQRIEHRSLRVGEKRHTKETVRVPQWDTPFAQRLHGVIAVRVKVVEYVAAGQYLVGKEQPIEDGADKERQQDGGSDVGEKIGYASWFLGHVLYDNGGMGSVEICGRVENCF